jgi:hypothetical protein
MNQVLSFFPNPHSTDVAERDTGDANTPKAKRNTKRIGDISEARVLAKLVDAGYEVLIPFGENHRYDLVIDDGERLSRIQVKTGRLHGGVIAFSCASSHAHRHGRSRPYFGEVEFLAVYCPQTDKVYLLPEQELTATTAHLRLLPTRNNMAKSIRWASAFELP